MNNGNVLSPFCVNKDDFNIDFIMNLDATYLRINGNYTLTKSDYDNLLVYSNVNMVDVYDISDFEIGNEIKVNVFKKIDFNSDRFKKLNITKLGYTKSSLTLNLPFNVFFVNDVLYSEEDDFDKLLKYIKDLEMLNINFDSIDVVDKVIDVIFKIENKIGKKIKFINCITGNRTIPDIEKLRFLEDDRIVKVWYEDGITDCSVDEFILMRRNIDNILESVNKKNLSPFEKVIYVYDIVKKFNYKKSNDNYSMEGRQLHKIFNTDSIVCSGYARIISCVLNELGIRAGIYKLVTNNCLHARCLVHIVDNKYNINSIYSMEPTWESMINNNSSYSMFLTPINKLKETFPYDKFRSDIDVLCGLKKINEIPLRDRISLYGFFNNKDLEQDYIDSVVKCSDKYVSLSDFCNALINVKFEQGITLNINDVVNYNNKLVSYLNGKMGTNINFFQ